MASSRVQSRCNLNLNSYQWQSLARLWFDPWEGTVYTTSSAKLKGFLMVTSPKQTRHLILVPTSQTTM